MDKLRTNGPWQRLKQTLKHLLSLPADAFDDVVAHNIEADKRFLKECQHEAELRKHTAKQPYANQQT